MKKLILILFLSLVFLLCFTSCASYEETKEYPIASARYYTKTIEDSGLFTTETNTYEKVEFIYIDSNKNYVKHSVSVDLIKISNKSKVVEEEGYFAPQLYLTLEDYENLLQRGE